MNEEDSKTDSPSRESTDGKSHSETGTKPPALAKPGAGDAHALVARMVKAGIWPPPTVLEQILNAGDAAVEPLHDVLRTKPKKSPARESLGHVLRLLSDLRRPATVPELVKIAEAYDDEICAHAADALVDFGSPGFEALASLCSNLTLSGYQRAFVLEAATDAAGLDSARRSRLAEIVRPMLDHSIGKAREALKSKKAVDKVPPENQLVDEAKSEEPELDDFDDPDNDVSTVDRATVEDDLATESDEGILSSEADSEGDDRELDDDDDEIVSELSDAEEFASVIIALATIADPLVRDTITTAFEEGLVDESIITRKYVDGLYAGMGGTRHDDPAYNWLDGYREDYDIHLESLAAAPPSKSPRSKYRYEDRYDEGEPPANIPATAPIRNTGPKVGRNDPCWCGSGKKYKKCHMGKE